MGDDLTKIYIKIFEIKIKGDEENMIDWRKIDMWLPRHKHQLQQYQVLQGAQDACDASPPSYNQPHQVLPLCGGGGGGDGGAPQPWWLIEVNRYIGSRCQNV